MGEPTLHAFANGQRDSVFFPTLDAICEALGCQPGDVLFHLTDKKKKKYGGANRFPPYSLRCSQRATPLAVPSG
jgi:hypothetical protein